MDSKNDVVVRFPPSPTGLFHMGNARTLLFNWIFAKQNNGKIVFRLEDTDKERSKEEYAQDIIENLKWLRIEPDFDTTVRQSERSEVYKKYVGKLLAEGKAYVSKEEPTEEGQRAEVIRFKNPNKKIVFTDLIRGEIEFDTTELKDFVIAKSEDEPLYHLAVVIDDFEMGVTHVIRGDDGISNTPRQILIQEAIEAPRPIYAHMPLVLGEDKAKLSKRKMGEKVSVTYYKKLGYEPEAIINFLCLIGWNPGTEQEIFSLDELVKIFDLNKVQKKGGIFNIEKLDWINREWILKQNSETQNEKLRAEISKTKLKDHSKLQDTDFMQKFLKIVLDRIHRWGEVSEILEAGEFDYLFDRPDVNAEMIVWKKQSREDAKEKLQKLLDANFEDVAGIAEREGRGEVLWPLRTSLSGREKSPDPFTLLDILGIEESATRVKTAIEKLS